MYPTEMTPALLAASVATLIAAIIIAAMYLSNFAAAYRHRDCGATRFFGVGTMLTVVLIALYILEIVGGTRPSTTAAIRLTAAIWAVWCVGGGAIVWRQERRERQRLVNEAVQVIADA